MKKLVFLFIIGLFSLVSTKGQIGYRLSQKATYVSGFDGDKPLKKNKMVEIIEVSHNGSQLSPEYYEAYKGENLKTFLERKRKEDSISYKKYLSRMNSLAVKEYNPTKKEIVKVDRTKEISTATGIVFILLCLFVLFKAARRR